MAKMLIICEQVSSLESPNKSPYSRSRLQGLNSSVMILHPVPQQYCLQAEAVVASDTSRESPYESRNREGEILDLGIPKDSLDSLPPNKSPATKAIAGAGCIPWKIKI